MGPGGQVIAFEPQPTLATALHRIIERRGWTNTSVHQLAVADAPGLLPLVIPGDGGPSPGARLVAEGEDTATGETASDGQSDGVPLVNINVGWSF